MRDRSGRLALAAALIAATCLAASAPSALANDGAIGTRGGTVRPVGDTDIRMDSEAVQVICLADYALYRIDFKFTNRTGGAKRVKLGFPFPDFDNEQEANLGESPGGFLAWLNGRPLAVRQEKGVDTDGEAEWGVVWFTHEADFPPGDSMVTVFYAGAPDSGIVVPEHLEGVDLPAGMSSERLINEAYPYLVHTGAGWSGDIGRTVIRYTLSCEFEGFAIEERIRGEARMMAGADRADRAANLEAYRKSADGRTYEWVYTDYEPTMAHDVMLPFLQPMPDYESFNPWEETIASSFLQLGGYEYPAFNAADGHPGSAWAEAAAGPGVGQWVEIPFGEQREIREIRVLPGYQKRSDLFEKYNRPKRLRVDFPDGTSQELELEDRMGVQLFEVSATAASAKVTILDAYPGTNERDETYLSEIDFAESAAPKFSTFEAITGVAAPDGFEEPAELLPLTEIAPPDDPGDAARETGAEASGHTRDDSFPAWLIAGAIGAALCGAVLIATVVTVILVIRSRRRVKRAGAQGAGPPSPPPPPAPPAP